MVGALLVLGVALGVGLSSCDTDHAKASADLGIGEQEPIRTITLPAKVTLGATSASATTATCGVELWPVKTLTDPQAGQVSLTPKLTTVAAVNALAVPSNTSTRTGDSFELNTWTVTATLTGYKLEADSDYHLVLQDGSQTMIAEIPLPACALGSKVLPQITATRAAFEAAHPQSAECFGCLHEQVTVTGVGFFDRPHGQNGVAANAAELHPLIAFTVGSAPVTTTTAPTTTTTPTTTTVPTTTVVTTTTGKTDCQRWPGRHYFHHVYHRDCQPNWFTTR